MRRTLPIGLPILLVSMLAAGSPSIAQPVPEFLGVYAVSGGKLVELKALAGSNYREMELMGADVLKGSSGIAIDDPRVYFIIYREGASSFTSVFLEEMKQVRYSTPDEFTRGGLQVVEDSWVGTELGYNLKVAPLKDNPQMMVRAVWPDPIPPGRYGLNIGSALFDLQIGPSKESCIVRELSLMGGGAKYTDCSEFFAEHPDARPQGSRGSAPAKGQGNESSESLKRGNGTVLDTTTKLMWALQDNGSRLDWEQGNSYCENLELDGFSDWRLPSLAEMTGIYVPAPGGRGLDAMRQGSSATNFGSTRLGLSLSTCCVWTSTSDEDNRKQFFSLGSGEPGRIMIKAIDLRLMRAICVRASE